MLAMKGYSGHAQYAFDMKEEQVINPDTGKLEKQRVLYFDNTWGPCEFKNTWKGDAGNLRTDYDRGFGGKYGYLLDKTGTTGITEHEMVTGTGLNHIEDLGKPLGKASAWYWSRNKAYDGCYSTVTD